VVVKVCHEEKFVCRERSPKVSIVFGTVGRESLRGPGNTVAVVYLNVNKPAEKKVISASSFYIDFKKHR
jgi:hypothetical protein